MKYFIPPTRVGCFLLLVVSMVHCIEPSNPSTVGSSSYAKVKYANGQKNNTYRFAFQRDPTIQYVSAEDLRPKPAYEDHQVPQITPEEWKTVTDNKKIVVGSSKSSSVSVQTSDNHRYYPTTTTEHQLYDTDPVEDHADQPDMWMQSSNEEGEVFGNNFEKQPTTERGQQNWGSVPSSSSSVSMSSSVSSSSGTSGTQSQNTPLYRDEPHHISDSSDGQFSSETQGFRTTSSTEDPFGSDTAEYAHASDDNLGHLVTDPTPMTTTIRATTRTVTTTPTTSTTNTVTRTTTSRKKSTTTSTEPTYITDSHFSADNVQAKTELPPQTTQRPPRPPTQRKDDQTGFSIFAQELAPGTGVQSAWRPFVGPPVKQVVSKKRPFNNRPVTLLINEATTDAPPPLFFKDPLPGSAIVGDNIQFGNSQGGSGMALFVPAPNPNDERVDSGVFGTIVDTHRPQFMQKPFSASPGQGPRPTPSGPLDLPPPSRDRIPQRPLQATAPRPPGLVTPGGKGDLDIEAILKDLKKKIPNGPVQINPNMVMNGNGGPPNRAPPQFQQRPQFQNQPPPPPPNFQGRPPQGFGPQGPPPQGFGPQSPPPQGFGPQGPPPQQGPQQGQINGRPFIMNNSPNGPVRPGFNPQVIADRNDVPGATFFNPQQQNNRFPESNMIIPPNQQQFPPNFRPPMMRPQFPPQQPQQQQPSSGNFFKNLWSRLFGRSLENPEDVPIVDVDSLYSNGTLPTEIYQHLANSTYAEAVDTLSKLGYGNFTFTEEPTISNSTEAN